MELYLLRHGETAYNAEKRYQGQRDIPLSPAGRAALRPAGFAPDLVYVSPLRRARETASLLFPAARQITVPDFAEMHFGVFEGRNYLEMAHDPDYLAWLDSGGLNKIPGGESKAEFCTRTCRAFAALVDTALAQGRDSLVIVAHGGTQMAVLERYALPRRGYYNWNAPPAGGFLLETDLAMWQTAHTLQLREEVHCTW